MIFYLLWERSVYLLVVSSIKLMMKKAKFAYSLFGKEVEKNECHVKKERRWWKLGMIFPCLVKSSHSTIFANTSFFWSLVRTICSLYISDKYIVPRSSEILEFRMKLTKLFDKVILLHTEDVSQFISKSTNSISMFGCALFPF